MAVKAKRKTIAERIERLHPCDEAAEWAAGYTSPAEAWKACVRGDWMLWLLGRIAGPPESDGRKKLVLCACECARTSLAIYEKRRPGDDRVRKCIETAERWAKGEATIDELRAARAAAAAYAAYAYAAAAAAAAAAADAAYAAAAADAAAYAAYAADAAYAAAAAAAAADAAYAADAARAKALAECADIVRKHYPKPPVISGD